MHEKPSPAPADNRRAEDRGPGLAGLVMWALSAPAAAAMELLNLWIKTQTGSRDPVIDTLTTALVSIFLLGAGVYAGVKARYSLAGRRNGGGGE